jgi:hypothetical protein
MTFIEMLEKEIGEIKKKPDIMNSIPFAREDCGAIMIAAMFKDGKMHYIFPHKKIVLRFTNDLVEISRSGDGWEKTAEQFRKQKLKPLIDENEFKL